MFDFTVKGSVVGWNTTMDGSKTFVKLQPAGNANGLQRDEKPGLLEAIISPALIKNLAMNALVTVRGKGLVYLVEGTDKQGRHKLYTFYRFEAENIEPATA